MAGREVRDYAEQNQACQGEGFGVPFNAYLISTALQCGDRAASRCDGNRFNGFVINRQNGSGIH